MSRSRFHSLLKRASAHVGTIVVPALLVASGATGSARVCAAADDTELRAKLVYQIAPDLSGCWDEAEFRRRITRRTGYDPFRDDAPLNILVDVTGSASAIGGRVEWRDEKHGGMGERSFVAKDGNCGKLLAEMSFAVALQIEMLRPTPKPQPARPVTPPPSGDAGTPASTFATADVAPVPPPKTSPAAAEPASPPPSRPEPESEPEQPGPPTPPQTEPAPTTWNLWAGAGPSIAWGTSPSATAALRLFLGARRGDLSVEIGGEATYPTETLRWQGAGFRATWMGGTAALCGHASALSACALGKVGRLGIEGLGVDSPEQPSSVVAHTGARMGAVAQLSKTWFIAARLEGLLLLTPRAVWMNDVERWRMPRWSWLAGVDVGIRFR